MSGLDRLKKAGKLVRAGLPRRLLLLGLATLAMILPAVGCLLAGGWLRLPGLAALLVWAILARWIWQAWRQWRKYGQNNFDDYA